jgi:plastocyanin
MRKVIGAIGAVFLASGLLASCGGSGDAASRTVLVDYKHDEFASSFLSYYPKHVAVHPGDTVRFEQTWTGEPHSVTMGKVVDDMFEFVPLFAKYNSEEEARAGGVDEATITRVNTSGQKLPGMTDDAGGIYQPGARPCYVTKFDDVPNYSDLEENILKGPETKCPTDGEPQPAFTGREALYNSGYIPWQGDGANTFEMKVAQNATPGTYNYFCNYHWMDMSGTVKIVPEARPARTATRRQEAARRDAHRSPHSPQQRPEATRRCQRR